MIDPFVSSQEEEAVAQQALSLFELNSRVHAVLHSTMPESYWVAAEISEARVASNGHCYMELVQKDSISGSLVAKARAMIWRQNYLMISSHFERLTGGRLTFGIKVLALVDVTFHELYGYSLNIIDIDPNYTLGDLVQRRKEIIKQLEEDGVLELNKELCLPRIIRRIAVISSATAAGYGDFCKQLEQSGFEFTVKLFSATMQGDKVEESVIAALDRIAEQMDQWDVVVIIRGGGATTDLNGFDTYLLAANVAQFPLPVLTGIGHERDDTIIDLVANTRLKTPTAVAAFLIERRSSEGAALQALQQRLTKTVQNFLQNEKAVTADLRQRCSLSAKEQLHIQRNGFNALAHRFELASTRYVGKERERMLRTGSHLEIFIQNHLQQQKQALQLLPQRMQAALNRTFMQAHHKHEVMERIIKLAGPERILHLGFSITFDANGKAVHDAAKLKSGDELTTTFEKGTIHSIVK